MKKSAVTLVLALAFSPISIESSFAEESKERDQKLLFSPEIFSLSKKKESSFDAPSATYVLTSEEIRRSGATSIPESLRLVPGLQVARIDGNKWAISARGSNAQYSNKLLVMIDGRTIYTPLFSGVLWDSQDYVMEDIDRIEVVRGPGGTIWGSNAVNGVINIITKNAAQTQGAYVSQTFGNQDRSITEARYGGTTASNDSYRLYVKKAVRDGVDQHPSNQNANDGNVQQRAGFRYDVTSIKDSKISIHGDIFNGRADNYFHSTSPIIANEDKDSRGGNLVVNWDKKLSKVSNFTLQTYFDYDQLDAGFLKRSARTYDVDFQHFYDFSKQNQFSWGLGYRSINDDIEESKNVQGVIPLNYSPNRLHSYMYSGFIQDKISLFDDKVSLTLGTKLLVNNFTGLEVQPSAKLAYYPARNQTLWASISRAVRTPTRGEDGLNLVNGNQKGSTNYKSENVLSYELGYRIKPSQKTSIDVATYFNKYTSLRTFERDNPASDAAATVANLGSGESYGAEISAKWQATDNWKLETSYDFFKTTIHTKPGSTDHLSTTTALYMGEGQSPEHQFKLKSFYNITPKLEFDNILYYVSGLPMAGLNSLSPGIPYYYRFDTRLGYLATKNLDLSLGIQDLFDQTHSEFKGGILNVRTQFGRTFYVKAVWQY
jgi:iron complex outermembrane receptor protein